MRGPSPGAARKIDRSALEELLEALRVISTADEAERFLVDLTTPAEREALAERWRIARLLDEGDLSYRAIAAATGASTATVVRVARCLGEPEPGGYRRVIDKLNRRKRKR